MPTLNDSIRVAVGGGAIADGLAVWYGKTAAETLQDAERRWLNAQLGLAANSLPINDLWMLLLTQQGYAGALQDKQSNYWLDQATIKTLFAGSEQGAFFDPYDLTTMFQDAAGTVKVTASGQPVGRILDKSGKGNHATQSNAAMRPIYTEADGLRYLLCGTTNFLVTGNIDFTATNKMTAAAGMKMTGNAAPAIVTEFGPNSNITPGSFGILLPDGSGTLSVAVRSNGNVAAQINMFLGLNVPGAVVMSADISAPRLTLKLNGIDGQVSSVTQGTGNYGNHALHIGARSGGVSGLVGHLHGVLVRGVASSASEINAIGQLMARKSGAPW